MATTPISGTPAPTSATNSNQSNTTGLPPQQITTEDFMSLLSAELQGQDPTQPVDPTTFVTQLAQFTELDQVSQIYTLLQGYLKGSSNGTGNGSSPSNSTGTQNPSSTGSSS
jgi:flagellar basal-body rod modification protein FlgD